MGKQVIDCSRTCLPYDSPPRVLHQSGFDTQELWLLSWENFLLFLGFFMQSFSIRKSNLICLYISQRFNITYIFND